MGNRQLFAQIGVFALLGLNVGAYYVFWPHKDSGAAIEAKAPQGTKGTAQLLPAKPDLASAGATEGKYQHPYGPPPKETPELVSAEPLHISNPPAPPVAQESDDDTVRKLLEAIKNDAVPLAAPKEKASADPAPRFDAPNPQPDVAVAPALTPQVAPSPWLMNMELVGNQTQLIAKLRLPPLEFKILCDRVEMKTPGIVQAVGKVTIIGAGFKGECQRLTLPLYESQLIFEEKAKIVHDANPSVAWRGERIVWEQAASAAPTPVGPAEFRPFNSYPIIPPVLGNPK